ncbi:MAG: sulfatase-like hydrolase/transferase [Defluviitaleaceae bacterium]|nr:sulfatase-like hydrolase/transferase [Defluviitaleaceae bacterium]
MSEFIKRLLGKRLVISARLTFAFLFIYGGMLTVVSVYLLPTRFVESIQIFTQSPMLILLNGLPIWLLIGVLFGISRNLVVTTVFPTVITFLMGIINRSKVFFRDEPFLPADIFLFNEVRYVTSEVNFIQNGVLPLIIFFTLLIISLLFVRPYKPKWRFSLPGALVCILCMAVLLPTVYWNQAYFGRFPVEGSGFRLVDIYNSRGTNYSFLAFLSRFSPERPPGFSEELAREILGDAVSQSHEPGHINVVVVMSESFSRLSDSPVLSFQSDPLSDFHTLAAREGSIVGDIIVPNFGGGTANTEFDVLTGMFTQFIRESPSSFWFIRQPMESVVSVFADRGYHTVAMHPGAPWFYNRQNVYRHLGFRDMYFRYDFIEAGAETITRLITEASTFDFLRDVISNRDRTQPIFAYMVTIQNHMPFANRFYSGHGGMTSDIDFSDGEMNELYNYFYGMRQSAEELLMLADFLEKEDEPFLLVFYSDHLPSFRGGVGIYERLGLDFYMNPELRFTVPYLIFANELARDLVSLEGVPTLFSANYMGQQLLSLLGFEQDTAWFSFLSDYMTQHPIMDLSSEHTDFRILQYYFMGQRFR